MREEEKPKIEEIRCKVVLLGEQGVGKSALVKKWFNNIFSLNYKSTIGADFLRNEFDVANKSIKLSLTDVGGAEKFNNSINAYLKDVNLVFLMWDSTRKQTYQAMRQWLELIVGNISPRPPVIFIRGKSDLLKGSQEEEVWGSDADVYKLAGDFSLAFFRVITTSAKGDKNFESLEKAIAEIMKAQVCAENPSSNTEKETKISYEPNQFKHTRKVRFMELLKMPMNSTGQTPSIKRYIWMLMHVISINDLKSQTSLWLQKQLAKDLFSRDSVEASSKPENHSDPIDIFQKMVIGDRKKCPATLAYYGNECSRLALGVLKDEFSARSYVSAMEKNDKELEAVVALLDLLSKKETQIIGFKICFFDAEIKRDKQYKEMGLIYEIAKRIFDFIFDNEIPLSIGQNDNNAPPLAPKVLTREQVLQGLVDRHKVEIPAEVIKIIDKFLEKPAEELSSIGQLATPKLF